MREYLTGFVVGVVSSITGVALGAYLRGYIEGWWGARREKMPLLWEGLDDECPAGGDHRPVPDSDENDDMRTFSSKTFHCDECGIGLPSPEREP